MTYQQLTIVGNLGRDPEMRYTQSGQAVTKLSVATNRRYKDVDETTWFTVSVFGKQAENVNRYLLKGAKVLVSGRLTPDRETGGPRVYKRNDGTFAASFEMVADRVVFLGGKQDSGGQISFDEGDDEIPF